MAEIYPGYSTDGKPFKKRRKTQQDNTPDQLEPSRKTDQPWTSIIGGHRGRAKYSREWNSGYDGSGKGTW